MITKEELKKEVDNLPDSLLNEAYALLKVISKREGKKIAEDWNKWQNNLNKFSSDFMDIRDQPIEPLRESLD